MILPDERIILSFGEWRKAGVETRAVSVGHVACW
jgi:hypothetical protein